MPTPSEILFFDLEVNPDSGEIKAYGMEWGTKQVRGKFPEPLKEQIEEAITICGHNIIEHDLLYLFLEEAEFILATKRTIDTLFLSALLFPKKPYHHLVKDYYLVGQEMNNPIADVNLTQNLLIDLVEAYSLLPENIQKLFYLLLKDEPGFNGFLDLFYDEEDREIPLSENIPELIANEFSGLYCAKAPLEKIIEKSPVELAYSLALIRVNDPASLPPRWLQHHFPKVFKVTNALRVSCKGLGACGYCPALLPEEGLKRFFGFEKFRKFDGDGEVPLQKQVVDAALDGKSLLAIFPTGGGKSLTFQLPALMKGAANRSLTVVISPLQSLMKDQVDVLLQRHGITAAVTINGMLSPLERTEAMDRVREGGANLLYISPEALRSKSIFNLLKGRHINRFVIDEAHCFSSWGQDFRVDYLYIGPFLKKIQAAKFRKETIPVSCFTATAKPDVIEDICAYFERELSLELQVFKTSAQRKNLSYHVLETSGEADKFDKIVQLLDSEDGPKIIYVSRVKLSVKLAAELSGAGYQAMAYHGKLDRDVKIRIQEEFMNGDLNIIVATSAFGMGVDKDNVKLVIHYTISDSLENYMQESGRAGRNPDMEARCFILYDEEDLGEHFVLLNSTKLSHKEVYQIWQGIKRFRKKSFSKSALEIAKMAGWDTEIYELETRVKVAIAALEDRGYVQRKENAPRIFAQSVLVENVEEANLKMEEQLYAFTDEHELKNARRIFSSLISRLRTSDSLRVDEVAEALGLERYTVSNILNLFKELNILSDEKDLTAYYYTVQSKRHSEKVLKNIAVVESRLFDLVFSNENLRERSVFLREINETMIGEGIDCNMAILNDVLNYWSIINLVQKERIDRANEHYRIKRKKSIEESRQIIRDKNKTAAYCITVFKIYYLSQAEMDDTFRDKVLLRFSVYDLKAKVEELSGSDYAYRFYEYVLLYLHHVKAIELKSGLVVFYNPMRIVRENENNQKKYTLTDYEKLGHYYQSKTEQIHIVGEYARKQLSYNEEAAQYVEDYFTLSYESFLNKYFPKRKGKIRQPITEEKFRQITGNLSAEQLQVINDNKNDNIMVAAGPGSGKTRVLVHKVASLLLMEDIKAEQFLMLTFSRPAALEFKTRLKNLVGKVAFHIDIFTYHAFAFRLAGRMGNLERAQNILPIVTRAIRNEAIPLEKIRNKAVLVVDEFQDVSHDEYAFMMAVIDTAEKIRVIVVGDDDQNVYEFRGANNIYMQSFIEQLNAKLYYLTKNYRARKNLVTFSNRFLEKCFKQKRIKEDIPLVADSQENGFIQLFKFRSKRLIVPLVISITKKKPQGTTVVLTQTNAEAILVTTLLNQENIPARLISGKSGFFLKDLLELRAFTHFVLERVSTETGLINKENWSNAKTLLFKYFPASKNLDLVGRIITAYEETHLKKFKSSWLGFLKEIKTEDFYHPDKDPFLVSTMHKVKGKEFDNVFILLDKYPFSDDAAKRVFYVAITRAKQNLFLYNNSAAFPSLGVKEMKTVRNTKTYPEPETLVLQCSLEDVWLGFYTKEQTVAAVKSLQSGARLERSSWSPSSFEFNREVVAALSRAFSAKLAKLEKKYKLKEACAKYIVVWYEENSGKSYRVVLPELVLRK